MNKLHIWQGSQINSELNATGKRQAIELGKKLLIYDVEIIYSSPLIRALQTAMLANPIPAFTFLRSELRECNFGKAEGHTANEVATLYPDIVEAMFDPTPDKWHKKFPGQGSESKKEVFDRVYATLMDIARTSSQTSIGISTHAAVMSSVLVGIGNIIAPVDNCSVIHLVYDEESDKLSYQGMI